MNSYLLPSLDLSADPLLRAQSFLSNVKQEIAIRRKQGESGQQNAADLSNAYDLLLQHAVEKFCPDAPFLLVGVGGYGRQEVSPLSDLDLVFLFSEENKKDAQVFAESLLYFLWDSKLEVGHSIRTVSDWKVMLKSSDLPALTSLLDARPIAGDQTLWSGVNALYQDAKQNPQETILQLLEERKQRRTRYGGAVFLLEPELKLGEGGLRDHDLARWTSWLAWGTTNLFTLCQKNVLPERLVSPLLEAKEGLLNLRGFLHQITKRRTDRLTFDKQEEIATLQKKQTETLMRGYYGWAKAVSTAVDEIFDRATLSLCAPSTPKKLEHGFWIQDQRILQKDNEAFLQNPHYITKTFVLAQTHSLQLHPSTRDQLAEAVYPLSCAIQGGQIAKEEQEQIWQDFRKILLFRDRKRNDLSQLHSLKILSAILPEWEPLSGLWLQDLYHVYTVDIHTLHALKQLRSFFIGEEKFSLESEIAQRIDEPFSVFFAILLHDIGKQFGAEKHSQRGAQFIPKIAKRMNLSHWETEEVRFLVENHLVLSQIAFRRDITDVAILSELAEKMGSLRKLRALYLLTLADISAVGPGVLNDWKHRLLRDLYFRTSDVLRRGEVFPLSPPKLSLEKPLSKKVADAIFRSRSKASLRYETPKALERQIETARTLLAKPVGAPCLLRNTPTPTPGNPLPRAELSIFVREDGASSEVIVCAPDTPGLLAEIAGVFSAAGIDILEARIGLFSLEGKTFVLDRFWVRDLTGDAVVKAARWKKAKTMLDSVLQGKVSAASLLAEHAPGWFPSMRHVVPDEVSLDLDEETRLIIEVYTQDRPGILYRLADIFSSLSLSIQVAKIMTEAGRVSDVFYLQAIDGHKISSATQEIVRNKIQDILSKDWKFSAR